MIGQEQQLQQLIANIALLHNELQQQSGRALDLQENGIYKMQAQLADLNSMISASVFEQLQGAAGALEQQIEQGGRQGMAEFSAQLDDLKRHMEQFARFAVTVEGRLGRISRSLMIKVAFLVGLVSVTAIGAAVWLGGYYVGLIRDSKITADSLRLYQQADLVKCGSGLCAKVESNTPAEYKKQGYLQIKPKQD